MNDKITDIETAPMPLLMDRIEHLYPFNADDVAIGNRKDPDKIAAFIEQARSEHKSKVINKAQLDPTLSFVCSIGTMDLDGANIKTNVITDASLETDLIRSLFSVMESRSDIVRLIGWSLEDFDLEYLWMRARILGIKRPERYRLGRYWNAERVVDLMKVWMFNNSKNVWRSLDYAVKVLGVQDPNRPEGVTGKDFWFLLNSDDEEEQQKAIQYARSDLVESGSVARAIL